jgi:hypothetical protein
LVTRNLIALVLISAHLMGCGPESPSDDTSSNDTTLEDATVSSDTESSDAQEDSVSDPCEGIDCGTGGECNAGQCECNESYEIDADGSCTDIDECMTDNGGCGENAQCSNQEGAAALCTCKPGFLYNPEGECVPTPACQFVSCEANSHCEEGACVCDAGYETDDDGACADIDECMTDNGGCGDALYYSCANNEGASATCADIDECVTNNGDCGDALYWSCANNEGTVATCADIDECASNNGGCGDALYYSCTNNEGGAATCTLANGLVCNAGGTPCTSGYCYEDSDGDGYDPGNATPSSTCQPTPQLVGVDCDDDCATCFPGSTATTSEVDDLDQNCDGNLNDYTGVPSKVCDLSATGQTASNGLAIPKNQMCQANGGPALGNYQPQGMRDGCAKWCENGGSPANPQIYNPSAGTVTSSSVYVTGSGYPGFNWGNCHFLPKTGFPMTGQGHTGCQTVNGGYPIRTCTCNGVYAFSGYH